MIAKTRLLLVATTVALLAASCGQKGPLTLPEDESRIAVTATMPVRGPASVDGAAHLV